MEVNGWNRTARLGAVALIAITAGLTGCNKGNKDRAALLEQENIELRTRNRQLEGALDSAEQDRAVLQGELRAAQAEADRLRTEPATGLTGFEGIAGVTSTALASGEIVLDVAGDVLFDSGKVTLKNQAKQTLDRIASVLNNDYPGRLVRVGGHTDTDPIRKSQWKTNERLSSERALAVEEYLVSKGVSQNRTYVAAFGPTFQKGNKSQSRRVEIVVMNGQAPN
ncbi:MAG: OmpA family protein [Phycisphaerales bacterium]